MTKDYTPEEIDKILQNLPEELKEAVFSMETADAIWNICIKQKITDERMTKIAEYTGYVLMGLLSPQEFQEALEKELKIETATAKKVAQEINRFIFYPVKPSLEQLYKMEITPSEKIEGKPSFAKTTEDKEEKPTKPAEEDVYRELIE